MASGAQSPPEAWHSLMTSVDLDADLSDLYPEAFFVKFAERFDRDPRPALLFRGVMDTAHAYLDGKALKEAAKAKLLKYSGTHLIGAGLSARRLSIALGQLSKSQLAVAGIDRRLKAVLEGDPSRPFALKANQSALAKSGPRERLRTIQELTSALEEAIGQLIDLPEDYDDERSAQSHALQFVDRVNRQTKLELPKNHATEEAARAFKPIWEAFSSVAYIRGRYRHEIEGYDCKPGKALFEIIAKLDTTVAPSLPGTAIENIRMQSKVE